MIRVSGEKDICRLADKLREIIMTGEVDVWWTPRNILCGYPDTPDEVSKGMERAWQALEQGAIEVIPEQYPDTPEPTLGDHTSGFKEDC